MQSKDRSKVIADVCDAIVRADTLGAAAIVRRDTLS